MAELTPMQAELCESSTTDYSDLNGVAVECIRAVDHEIATGVWPDMTEHGWEVDGNQRPQWDACCRTDFPNPEHRA